MEIFDLNEPGVKLLLEGWEFVHDDSLLINCKVKEVFASVTHKVGGKTVYLHTRLEPDMNCNILVRKVPARVAESDSFLPIIGEILRRTTAEMDLQSATLLVESNGKVYTKTPIEQKETF